jgi:uncharacterized protein with von Willebrand factor type A (vWA) domain
MSREELLDLLAKPTGDTAELDVDEGCASLTQPESPTALKLDDWSIRRGKEVLSESERLRQTFELPEGEDDPFLSAVGAAELATADFHGAAFEPDPKLAERPKNERISRYMKQLMNTPEFQALHAETQLDEVASEIAATQFAEQWVQLIKKEEPEDEFQKDMQCLRAAGGALESAKSEVSDLRDAQAAFGLGQGAAGSPLTASGLKDVFKRVQGSQQLKRICELAGRYRRFAQAQQRKKVLHGMDDVVGVVLAGDPGRILPHELVALADEDLELDAMRRLVEGQMMCRDYRGVESKAKGPIVVVVDESGSMCGEKIYTAKAMALALYWVARQQRRYVCLVGFSGGEEGVYLPIPPNKPMQGELMEWLEHFYGGGTTLDVPLVELPKNWDALGCPEGKTDIICITDAIVHAPDSIVKSFLAWKAVKQVKMISLILESQPGDLAKVSDRTHTVRSLALDEAGVGEALSV